MSTIEQQRLSVAQWCITRMHNNFDSHDFIRVLSATHPEVYRQWLDDYASIQSCHSQIGIFLANQATALSIEKTGEHESLNIYNECTTCAQWKKQ